MIFEGEFFFHGMSRWNLGWATPNYAGAFLVTLVCFAWAIRGKGRFIVAGLLFEATLYFLLAKTYSRGALVALAAGAIFFIAGSGLRNLVQSGRIWALRTVVIVGCVVGSGFIGRITPGYTQTDGSIGNRLDLWRGGLEMIASSAWTGWGAGESGRAYMNWFQPIGDTEVFTTMVNSYLHVAVEHGLFFLCVVLALLFVTLILAWRRAADGDALAGAAGASLLVWAVANIFTTLWIEPKLWIVPGIAIAVIIWRSQVQSIEDRKWLANTALSVGAAIAVSLLLFAVGAISTQRYSWKVVQDGDGVTALISRATNAAQLHVWNVWSDTVVFGPTPGQELRRWAETHAVELHVHRPANRKLSEYVMEGGLILSGNQAERLGRDSIPRGIQELWLLHPSSPPPASTGVFTDPNRSKSLQIVVVLPAIDETGLNTAWQTWATNAKARVIVSADSGLDLRTNWSKIAPQETSTRS